MINSKDKTKEELIIELNELQQELNFHKLSNSNALANKKMLENEDDYRYLFDNNPQPMWIYDLESLRFLEINNAAVHHYGYSREEFLGMTIKDIRPKEDLEALQKDIELTQQAYNLAGEWRHLKKNGEIIFVEIISHEITINNRKARHVMANDITLQKRAIEDKTETLIRYNALVEQAGDAFFVHDFEGKFIEVNQQACDTLGYSKEELLKLSVTDVEMDFDLKSVKKEWAKIEAGINFTLYGNQRRKDGTIFPVEVRFGCSEWKGQKLFLGLARDITERKHDEEQLRKLSRAVEQSPISIILTDTQGNIEYANPKTLKVSGYELAELIGKNPKIFSAGEKPKEAYKVLWQNITSGKEWQGEFHNKKKNGELFWEQASISPILNKEGEITHYLAVKEDITERKQILEDLIIAKEHAEQSDKLKSAFLANMSHEIRTPMNSILGFTELLKAPELSGEKLQKYINVIQKGGTRLLNIINDIVDISKIEAGLVKADIKASNIKEQIEFIYTFFKPEAEKKGIQFLVNNSSLEEDLMIVTDPEKIYAIFTNLIKNAIKFTNKGLIVFGYEKKGEYLEFYVKDTGIGIPKDKYEAIFERFIQADISNNLAIQGAGLGLSITKAYVELLEGKIWVESEVENLAIGKPGGTTIYFTIPFNTGTIIDTNTQNDILSGKTGKQSENLKILIAEDDEASAIYLSILVEEFSSEILMAKNGLEAVEIYKNNPDIDLILMDMQMPYLNGYEATSQIRQLNKNVVIIAQTAFALSYDRQKVIDAGCNDYISKPISINEFTTLIRKHFN